MIFVIDGERIDPNALSLDQLIALKDKLDTQADGINHDLTLARARKIETGEYTDAQWYARATLALKHKRRQTEHLKNLIAALKKEARIAKASKERHVSHYFMQICQDRMPVDVFQAVFEEAVRLKERDEREL